jgi:methylmalonyl-CoA mutase cobalamin-binding subunit
MTDTFTSHAAVSAPHAHVAIFDTTMRDGEQSPGASMSHDEKLQLAEMLEDLRVDVIEAGFPIASNGDYAAVRAVSERVKESVVCGLARAGAQDIERCADALKPARRGRIHTFLSTSPQHRDHILRMSPEEVIEAVTRSVTHARNLCDDVEWSAQDATRTERDVLRRCVEAGHQRGGDDHQPARHGRLHLSHRVRGDVPATSWRTSRARPGGASAHCHNDLGLAWPTAWQPSRRSAAGGVRHQRHRRAGRERGAGGDRHGAEGAGRRAALRHGRGRDPHRPRQPLCVRDHRLSGAVQQGDRRQERLSPTRAASTRTGCSRTPRPTRSCGPRTSGAQLQPR